jgi:hypothetical protein
MKLVRVLAILSLTACANEGKIKYYQTDEIRIIAEKFESEIKHIDNIVITIVNSIESSKANKEFYTIGQCQISNEHAPTIILLKEYWEEANYNEKESLLYHELGHCVLMLGHDESVSEDGRPLSIMYSSQLLQYWYDLYRQDYMQDLINKEKGRHVLYTNNPIQE